MNKMPKLKIGALAPLHLAAGGSSGGSLPTELSGETSTNNMASYGPISAGGVQGGYGSGAPANLQKLQSAYQTLGLNMPVTPYYLSSPTQTAQSQTYGNDSQIPTLQQDIPTPKLTGGI